MILVDANLLIYAHVKEFAEHSAAREWLDEQLNEQPRVGRAAQRTTACRAGLAVAARVHAHHYQRARVRAAVEHSKGVGAGRSVAKRASELDPNAGGAARSDLRLARASSLSAQLGSRCASCGARDRTRSDALLDRRRLRTIPRAAVGKPAGVVAETVPVPASVPVSVSVPVSELLPRVHHRGCHRVRPHVHRRS